MQKLFVLIILSILVASSVAFTNNTSDSDADKLRKIYSQSPDKWPAPFIDEGVDWKELGILPASPLENKKDSLRHLIELGKILFFDTRLSGSEKISCATCHQPELSWTDGKEKSLGHEGTINKRNSPTIQNTWFYNKLFWDGRSSSLEDQSFAPINSESEMHGDMRELSRKLKNIKGYLSLFDSAFGDPSINPQRISKAIAVFERTVVSRKSKLDEFLAGKKKVLNNEELKGLHLFRTKARCMNCHNGPLFSDNQFHNNGFAGKDVGLYFVTHKDEDMGKFKTPSLRDIQKTGPWMHDGSFNNLAEIVEKYNHGTPGSDQLVKPLSLNKDEINALLSFLNAISSPPMEFKKPILPQ
jgi:cytochrome c peroxidase